MKIDGQELVAPVSGRRTIIYYSLPQRPFNNVGRFKIGYSKTVLLHDTEDGLRSVSYTHLDVYKRQVV